jgi:hypothetical protein
MATTYKLIDKAILTGNQTSIDFVSIPSTYTDLLIRASLRSDQGSSNGQDIYIQFNNDTAANYSFKRIYGTGSSAASDGVSSASTAGRVGRTTSASATVSTFASNDIYIPNYTSSNQKSVSADGVEENNATASLMSLNAVLWTGTSAISSFKIFPFSATNFVQYSSIYLYGIKKS